MRYAEWFHRGLKVVGLVLLALAVVEFLPATAGYLHDRYAYRQLVQQGMAFGYSSDWQEYVWLAAPLLVQMAIGLYLLLGGRWLVNLCIPPHHCYCPSCGYDRTVGGEGPACPECGEAFSSSMAS